MNEITTIPSHVTSAGHTFSYVEWTAGTQLSLSRVPWDDAYNSIVDFNTRVDLDNYLHRESSDYVYLENVTYARPGYPVRIPLPFNSVYSYNYLRVHNPSMPVEGDIPRTFYYFIQDVRYVAPNTTELVIQIDVWNSFRWDINFGQAYLERGHWALAYDEGNDKGGRGFLTTPEGMDLGSDYSVVNSVSFSLGHKRTLSDAAVGAVILSMVDLTGDHGTVDNPKLESARPTMVKNMPHGASVYYAETVGVLEAYMNTIASKPWVAQGIISITLCPALKNPVYSSELYTDTQGNKLGKIIDWESRYVLSGVMEKFREIQHNVIPEKYRKLSKFKTSPYMFIELTMYDGKPLLMKPELLNWSETLDIVVENIPIPPSPRCMYLPLSYNYKYFGTSDYRLGESYGFASGLVNLPQVSTVNDSYLSFLASNANGLQYSYQSAEWTQQRNAESAALSYANTGVGLSGSQRQLNNSLATNSANLNNQLRAMNDGYMVDQGARAFGVFTGAANGAVNGLRGGAVGALAGAAGAAVNGVVPMVTSSFHNDIANKSAIESGAITARSMGAAQQINAETTREIADNNLSYAKWANNGDYQNAIAGINSRVQDAKLLSPTMSGQIGGEPFMYIANAGFKVQINFRVLQENMYQMIGDYWLRYGYAVNRFINMAQNRLSLFSKFTYWKVKDMKLGAGTRCPELYKNTIRGIFEKGVTVYLKPDYIRDTDIYTNNQVLSVTL